MAIEVIGRGLISKNLVRRTSARGAPSKCEQRARGSLVDEIDAGTVMASEVQGEMSGYGMPTALQ